MSKSAKDTRKVTPSGKLKTSSFDKFSTNTVLSRNLPQKALTKEIRDFFKSLGEIKYFILPWKRDLRGRRFGFVKARTREERKMRKLIMGGKLMGYILKVDMATIKSNIVKTMRVS